MMPTTTTRQTTTTTTMTASIIDKNSLFNETIVKGPSSMTGQPKIS